jgi:hypothetical protein
VNWQSRLPSGVSYGGRTGRGFKLAVSMPVDEEGMSPCLCPDDAEHRFKVVIGTHDDELGGDSMYCPYCGKQARADAFLRKQMARARAAMEQAATQYVHAEVDRILRNAFGPNRSRTSSLSVTYKPASRPRRRPLPTFEVEPTRRSMSCMNCDTRFAVYSLATYCPRCGRLAPAQQFTTLVRLERDRIRVFDSLAADQRLHAEESGLITTTYEGAIKNGFGALETYLKEWFRRDATGVIKPPSSTTFQRLDDANALFKKHLGVDLEAAAGPDIWQAMHQAAAIRHVLTHNAGVIDEKFRGRMPSWHQALGQRLNITEPDTLGVLDALETFAVRVLPSHGEPASAQT